MKKSKQKKKILRNQRGQSLIEYVILVALVGVATMGMVRALQKTVNVNMGRIVNTLQGQSAGSGGATHERVQESDLQKKSFEDFMNGAGR